MSEQVLELVFKTTENDTKVISIADPRADVNAAEAHEAMETLITSGVIECSSGDITEVVEARLRVTEVTVLK